MKANGKLIGEINNNTIKLEINSKMIVEILPLSSHIFPVNFIIDDNFMSVYQEGIIKADLKGAFYIKFTSILFYYNNFRLIEQTKIQNTLITVFCDNGYKISFENNQSFYIDNIPPCEKVKIHSYSNYGVQMAVIELLNNKKILNIYLIKNQIKKIFSDEYTELDLSKNITVTKKYIDIAKHTCISEYVLKDEKLIINNLIVNVKKDFSVNELPFSVLPINFFETILCGDSLENICSKEFIQKKDKIKQYLGNYIGVFPPPDFRNINEVGLIYKINEGIYKAEYFALEFEGRLITNIIKK